MGSRAINTIINCALVILLVMIGLSYHPVIVSMSKTAGYESGTILSRYIELLFIGIFGLSLLSKGYTFARSKTITSMIIWMIVIVAVGMLASAVFSNSDVLGDLKYLIMVFGAMVVGWNLLISQKFLYVMFLAFAISIIFSGLSQVFINIGGFNIEDQYLADAKNSLGVLLASSTLILLFIARNTKELILRRIFIAGVALGLLILLVIRARMSFIACVTLIIYYYYLCMRNHKFIGVYFLLVLALCFVSLFLPSSIIDFVGASMTARTEYGGDFSSGRFDTYIAAIDIFARNPFLANIENTDQIAWVHNFPLLKLSSFGLLFSWPVLTLYCIILWKALSRSFRFRGAVSFCNLILLVPYMVSMAEPTFPFGPGTVTVFNFLLFGMADRAITTRTQLVI